MANLITDTLLHDWSSTAKIRGQVDYTATQDGNNVKYDIIAKCWMASSFKQSWYGYNIRLNLTANGNQLLSGYVIKSQDERMVAIPPTNTGKVYVVTVSITQPLGSTLNVEATYYNGSSDAGSNWSKTLTQQGGATPPFIVLPTVSVLSVTNVTDKTANASFALTSNGGGNTDYYIDIATSNFSNIVGTRTSEGQFNGLIPRKNLLCKGKYWKFRR